MNKQMTAKERICERCLETIGPLCQHVVWYEEDGTEHKRHAIDCTAKTENRTNERQSAEEAEAENQKTLTMLLEIRRVVREQAKDQDLWFRSRTINENYLQRELRRLHAVIEGEDLEGIPGRGKSR
jgi:hypothetical protein